MPHVEPNWAVIEPFLASKGLRKKEIAAEGNCLFMSLADQIMYRFKGDALALTKLNSRAYCNEPIPQNRAFYYNLHDQPLEGGAWVRKEVCLEFTADQDFYSMYLVDNNYIARMKKNSAFGGDQEIAAAVRHFRIRVCVINAHAVTGECQTMVMDNNDPGMESEGPMLYIMRTFWGPGNSGGDHYSSLHGPGCHGNPDPGFEVRTTTAPVVPLYQPQNNGYFMRNDGTWASYPDNNTSTSSAEQARRQQIMANLAEDTSDSDDSSDDGVDYAAIARARTEAIRERARKKREEKERNALQKAAMAFATKQESSYSNPAVLYGRQEKKMPSKTSSSDSSILMAHRAYSRERSDSAPKLPKSLSMEMQVSTSSVPSWAKAAPKVPVSVPVAKTTQEKVEEHRTPRRMELNRTYNFDFNAKKAAEPIPEEREPTLPDLVKKAIDEVKKAVDAPSEDAESKPLCPAVVKLGDRIEHLRVAKSKDALKSQHVKLWKKFLALQREVEDAEVRSGWTVGSPVEIHSVSAGGWVSGTVTQELLSISYKSKAGSHTKSLARGDKNLRPVSKKELKKEDSDF